MARQTLRLGHPHGHHHAASRRAATTRSECCARPGRAILGSSIGVLRSVAGARCIARSGAPFQAPVPASPPSSAVSSHPYRRPRLQPLPLPCSLQVVVRLRSEAEDEWPRGATLPEENGSKSWLPTPVTRPNVLPHSGTGGRRRQGINCRVLCPSTRHRGRAACRSTRSPPIELLPKQAGDGGGDRLAGVVLVEREPR